MEFEKIDELFEQDKVKFKEDIKKKSMNERKVIYEEHLKIDIKRNEEELKIKELLHLNHWSNPVQLEFKFEAEKDPEYQKLKIAFEEKYIKPKEAEDIYVEHKKIEYHKWKVDYLHKKAKIEDN